MTTATKKKDFGHNSCHMIFDDKVEHIVDNNVRWLQLTEKHIHQSQSNANTEDARKWLAAVKEIARRRVELFITLLDHHGNWNVLSCLLRFLLNLATEINTAYKGGI